MSESPLQIQEQLLKLLQQIFQFDQQELNFGLYRLMNFHRVEITRFLKEELLQGIDEQTAADCRGGGSDAQRLFVFNHLIRFFSRYYRQGDLFVQRRYGRRPRYWIPYNGEETYFHWVNKGQYYVKSGEYFSRYAFQRGGLEVRFYIDRAETETANRKAGTRKYMLPAETPFRMQGDVLELFFDYRPLQRGERYGSGRSTSQAAINEEILTRLGVALRGTPFSILLNEPRQGEKSLAEHLSQFARIRNRDYFIHKDLAGFLSGELDFYLKNELLEIPLPELTDREATERLSAARVFQKSALRIISLLRQIEELRKMLWEKRSLIYRSDYVFTIEAIASAAGADFLKRILPEILVNRQQIDEWRRLFKLPPISSPEEGEALLAARKWRRLPLDTRYFPRSFRDELLQALTATESLDNLLDGILFNSDNFQALNLLQAGFAGKIKTVFIDPPFNKESEADYAYKVGFKDSTWNTMLENRISLARTLLREDGCMFVRCDYNGTTYVRLLMDAIFGRENFRNELIINRTLAKQGVDSQFVVKTESLFLYGASRRFKPHEIERPKEPRWFPLLHFPRANRRPREVLGITFYPPRNRRWALSQERIDRFAQRGKIRINPDLSYRDCRGMLITGMPEILYDSEVVGNEWLDIPGYAQKHHFATENAEALLERVIAAGSDPGDWVMDFFLGSGTTTAVAQRMGRRWIGVEMGEHFDSVVLPRMKRTLFAGKGRPGAGFRYHLLEQFEDAIENLPTAEIPAALSQLPEFTEGHLVNYSYQRSSVLIDPRAWENPFDYNLRALQHGRPLQVAADLPETFNYLLGLTVQRVRHHNDAGRRYLFIEGEVEGERALVVWRPLDQLDVQRDADLIRAQMGDDPPRRLYVNGDCGLPGCLNIESQFMALLTAAPRAENSIG